MINESTDEIMDKWAKAVEEYGAYKLNNTHPLESDRLIIVCNPHSR
jgi:hypothetical protein